MKRLLVIITLLLTACKSVKPPQVAEKIERDSISVQIQTKEITKGFDDFVFIPVPYVVTGASNCDSLCNEALKRQLTHFKTSKTSGNHQYSFAYQPGLHGFGLNVSTQDQENTNHQVSTNVSQRETKIEVIHEPYIPRWVWWVMAWGVFNLVFWIWRIGKILT